jgi:hypothetical protein
MIYKYVTHKYASRYVYILFHKKFLIFEDFFDYSAIEKWFNFLLNFYCDMFIGRSRWWGVPETMIRPTPTVAQQEQEEKAPLRFLG